MKMKNIHDKTVNIAIIVDSNIIYILTMFLYFYDIGLINQF